MDAYQNNQTWTRLYAFWFRQYVKGMWQPVYPPALQIQDSSMQPHLRWCSHSLPPWFGAKAKIYVPVQLCLVLLPSWGKPNRMRGSGGRMEGRWFCLVSVFILKSYLVDLKALISSCYPWLPLVLGNTAEFSSRNLVTEQLGLVGEKCSCTTSSPTLGIFQLFSISHSGEYA